MRKLVFVVIGLIALSALIRGLSDYQAQQASLGGSPRLSHQISTP